MFNKVDGNLQSSPNRQWLHWLGFCIGDSQKIQIFGIRQRLGTRSQEFGLLFQPCLLMHSLFTQLHFMPQFFLPKGSSCIASDCPLSLFSQELLVFSQWKERFFILIFVFEWTSDDLEVDWKICETAAKAYYNFLKLGQTFHCHTSRH